MTIPKQLHQVYLGFDNPIMPDKWADNADKWKSIHPEYAYTLWNMDMCVALITELAPSFLDIWLNYPRNVQRADAIRPFILYKHGGVYTDMDTSPHYNITPLLDVYSVPGVEVIVAPSANSDTASNWLMASTPKSLFWVMTITEMVRRSRRTYWFDHTRIMYSTGPALISDMIAVYGKNKAIVMNMELVNSVNICGSCSEITNYVIDDHGATWNGPFTKVLNAVFCAVSPLRTVPYYSWLVLVLIIVVILLLVYARLRRCRTSCKL
jgi:mannosyltransferase OCH1-like enzyme